MILCHSKGSIAKAKMFNQPEVCVISDLHFGVHQNSPIWHQTALEFAKWLKKQLNERGIKDIIIAGDVFHNRNDVAVNTLNVVADIFNLWAEFNIVILVGNHDAFYRDRADVNSINILNGWKNITVFTQPTMVDYMHKKLFFCPWGTTLPQIQAADIIFGHFEITSFKMNNFKVCDRGFQPKQLFDKSNLIISGHFHLREERNYEDGTIIYLGSPYEMDWSDKDSSKGVYILDLCTKKHQVIENTLSPKHVEIRLTDLIKNGLKDLNIKGNIVRFVVDKDIDTEKIDLLGTRLASYQPLSFNIEYYCFAQTDQSIDLQQADVGVNITKIISDFVEAMEVKNKEKVNEYVLELYQRVQQ